VKVIGQQPAEAGVSGACRIWNELKENAMFAGFVSKLGVKGLVAGSLLSLMPTAAFARHHGDVVIDLPLPGAPAVVVQPACAPGRVWIEPVVQTVDQQQWVAPVYQSVDQQVWVPDTTATQDSQVYVAARYDYRDVIQYDYRGYAHRFRQQVLVSPAHYESAPQTVVVPGHFETRSTQVMVADGHYQTVPVQQVITPGHWQGFGGGPAVVVEHRHAGLHINLPLPF
jgi:hypothetical protein